MVQLLLLLLRSFSHLHFLTVGHKAVVNSTAADFLLTTKYGHKNPAAAAVISLFTHLFL